MAEGWGGVSRQRLIETINILWILTEAPGYPERTTSDDQQLEIPNCRQLTFEHEKSLTEILAFFSGTTDDPSKVMAVCIEEGVAGCNLTIRLATNSGDCSKVLSGFRKMAVIMEQSSTRKISKDEAYRGLVHEVVQLNFRRILCRLRSKHAVHFRKNAKTKPALVGQLFAAVNGSPGKKSMKKLPVEKATTLRTEIQILQSSFDKLEAIQNIDDSMMLPRTILIEMVEQFAAIAQNEALACILTEGSVVESLGKQQSDHLVRAVGKLGRYCSASKDLICAARTKQYSVFNQISVMHFQLPQPPKCYLQRTPMTLQHSIDSLVQSEDTLKHCGLSRSVRSYLGSSYLAKSSNFEFRTSDPSTSWKVHAEIQLMFFYELHKVRLPPRVICASKRPCYLCQVFFDLHGGFHVPETHGRLYPGWILPIWIKQLPKERRREIGELIDELHRILVLRIKGILGTRRLAFNPPNESVICSAITWSVSSVQSKLVATESIGSRPELQATVASPEIFQVSMKHEGSRSLTPLPINTMQSNEDVDQALSCQSDSTFASETTEILSLSPGEVVNTLLAAKSTTLYITTGRLNLIVSRELGPKTEDPGYCWIRCAWLDSTNRSTPSPSRRAVDVIQMDPGSELICEEGAVHSTSDLLIQAGGEVLSIKFGVAKLHDRSP